MGRHQEFTGRCADAGEPEARDPTGIGHRLPTINGLRPTAPETAAHASSPHSPADGSTPCPPGEDRMSPATFLVCALLVLVFSGLMAMAGLGAAFLFVPLF